MISYLGVPIMPDGEIFGTICVLDRQSNGYSDLYLKLLLQWRDVLQADLTSIATSEQRFRVMQAELAHANRLATWASSPRRLRMRSNSRSRPHS